MRPARSPSLRKLADPDVRRGLDAALTVLGTLGAELHDPTPGVYSNHDGKYGARA